MLPSIKWILLILCVSVGCAHTPRKISSVDVDGDKGVDYRLIDINNDGIADGVDRNGDGIIDARFIDVGDGGKYRAIDIDGDGKADGGDFDGDGVITFFDELGEGAEEPSESESESFPGAINLDSAGQLDLNFPPNSLPVQKMDGIDLRALLPRPGNQGKLNSCSAWAVALVAAYERGLRESAPPQWPSQKHMYDVMLASSNTVCPQGSYIHVGLNELVVRGAPEQNNPPYNRNQCLPASAATPRADYRIGSWMHHRGLSRALVKEALQAGRLVIFEATIPASYKTWSLPTAKGVFSSIDGPCRGQHCGGHSMVIIGYSDVKSAYLVQNSWGTDWGDGGYAWWAFADLEKRTSHSYIPIPIKPSEPLRFGDPNASGFVATSVKALTTGTILDVHLHFTEPAWVSDATVTFAPGKSHKKEFKGRSTFAMFDGPLRFNLPRPIANGLYNLALKLELRDGSQITRNLKIRVKNGVIPRRASL